MPRPDEVLAYLAGIADMARGVPRGLSSLDLSTDGFWRSFWAYLYALPAYLYFWYVDRATFLAENPGVEAGFDYIARIAVREILAVILSLVAVALLARPLNMTNRFAQWVIAANWLSLPVAYVTAAVFVLTIGLGGSSEAALPVILLVWAATLFVAYRVYRVALNDDGMLAVILIVLTFAVGFLTLLVLG